MQGAVSLVEQYRAERKARLARLRVPGYFAKPKEIPAPVVIETKPPEVFLEENPRAEKTPLKEWAPRPLDRANEAYPEIVRIQQIVAKHFAVDVYDMLKPGREGRGSVKVSRARQAAVYLCHIRTRKSYPFLGRCFGRRDHTTIMHSVRAFEQLIAADPYAAADLAACEALL